jgi:dTDP-glucose 4,6-dehydratase
MQYSEKTILVAGGAGFIGSSFVSQAVAKGYHVIVFDALTYAGHRENLEKLPEKSYELIIGNICDAQLLSDTVAKYKPSAILNFAAESHVDNSIAGPRAFIDTNVVGCFTLLEAAREYWYGLSGPEKQRFRFIQLSTDEVYGSLGASGKVNENTAMRPNSPYSASKAAGDHLTRAWFETYGLPTIITNCTNNYGPRQHTEKLIPLMIISALAERSMPVYGDGRNIRDWIHVEDHCAGVMLAFEKGRLGQTYAFGGDTERDNNEVVGAICTILDKLRPRKNGQSYKQLITYVKDRPGHDRRYAIDDFKAQCELGFTRKYRFEDGLRATVEWYLENQSWCEAVQKEREAA